MFCSMESSDDMKHAMKNFELCQWFKLWAPLTEKDSVLKGMATRCFLQVDIAENKLIYIAIIII